jgi:hypothetical protein
MKSPIACLAAVAAGLLASCGTVDLNSLIATIDDNGTLATLRTCAPSSGLVAAAEANAIPARAPTIFGMLPDPLQNDAVVRAAFWQSQNVTLKAAAVAAPSFTSAAAPTGLTPGTPPPMASLTPSDFYKFGSLVAEYVLRQPNVRSGMSDAFAQTVSQYYLAYYAGKFTTYFGASYAQPTVSMTIGDNEITQAAMVFVELLFDQILSSQVWSSTTTDGDGKKTTMYYPGGTTKKPTVATLDPRILVSIPTSDKCTMTVAKATLINYVAQEFATAASANSALTIKSVGGVEIGLGILGKLSIGDNNTLSNLAKNVASEVVLRLTAQLAYTVLKPYYVDDMVPAPGVAMAKVASGAPPPAPTKLQNLRALFISPNPH